MGDLCEDLLENILFRVPLKPLTRMKCVSKDWCCLISHIRRSKPRLSSFGLILFQTVAISWNLGGQFYKNLNPPTIIVFDVKDQGRKLEYLEHNAFRHILHRHDIKCVCFFNGFMLLVLTQGFMSPGPAFIYNPMLKQQEYLPSFHELDDYRGAIMLGMGLAPSDGVPNLYFRVVCFYFNKKTYFNSIPGFMDYMILSSEIGDWRNHYRSQWRKHRARLVNYSSVEYIEFNKFSNYTFQAFFLQQSLYWNIEDHLLVYKLQEDVFEIHDLPRIPKTLYEYPSRHWDECLWASEGCLHYCYSNEDEINIWTRDKGRERDSKDEYNQYWALSLDMIGYTTKGWKLKHTINLKLLRAKHPHWEDYDRDICFSKPCAFNEDLQVLHLRLPGGEVGSYSFETGRLNIAIR